MSTKLNDKLIKDIPGGARPALVRQSYLKQIVDQLNRNTVFLATPRGIQPVAAQSAVDGELIEDLQDGADTLTGVGAVSDIWKEVSKVYEEVDVDGVTIRRRTSSLFRSNRTGELVAFFFDNTDLG